MSANDDQVAGTHYKSEYQHWDWAIDLNIGPLEYGATRYVCRHWKKNGVEDLRKALHFVNKLSEVIADKRYGSYLHMRNQNSAVSSRIELMQRFVEANKIPYHEARICEMIALWQNPAHITEAAILLEQLIAKTAVAAQQGAAPGAATTTATITKAAAQQAIQRPGEGGKASGSKTEHPAPFGYQGDDTIILKKD